MVSGFPAAVGALARRDIDGSEAEIDTSKDDQNRRQGKKPYAHIFPFYRTASVPSDRDEEAFLSRRIGSPNGKPHLMVARSAIIDADMRVASFRELIDA